MLRSASLLSLCLTFGLVGCTGGLVDGSSPDDESTDALVNAALDTDHRQIGLVFHSLGGVWANYCTGSLIGTHTVLTAGHCVYENGGASPPDRMSFKLDGKGYAVARVVLHESYDPTRLPANDVAVLELVNDVPDLMPIQLATTPPRVGERMLLVGFGRYTDSVTGDQMRRNGMNDISDVGSAAFTMLGSSGNDTGVCHGDSGGPSLAVRPSGMVIAGIHSTSSCDRKPVVNGVDLNDANDTRVDVNTAMIKVAAAGNLYMGGAYEQAPPTVSVERLALSGGGERGLATDDVVVRVTASDDQRVDRINLFVNGTYTQTVPVSGTTYVGDLRLGHLPTSDNGKIWIQASAFDRAGRRANANITF